MGSLTLIERLDAATEGSRELDVEIWVHDGGEDLHGDNNLIEFPVPHYTTSTGDAETLVPEGSLVMLEWTKAGARCSILRDTDDVEAQPATSTAATPALALTSAALKAQER